jgi:hypothetical protein
LQARSCWFKSNRLHFFLNTYMSVFFSNSFNISSAGTNVVNSFFGVQRKNQKSSFYHQQIFLSWFENNTFVGYFSKETLKHVFKNKLQLSTFSSTRFKKGYPVNGQRTRSNGKTSKKLFFSKQNLF